MNWSAIAMSDIREQKIPEDLKNRLLKSFPSVTTSEVLARYSEDKMDKIKECVEYLKSKGFAVEDYKRNFKDD